MWGGGGGKHSCVQPVPSRGVWGHAPPENFWILGVVRLILVQSEGF